MDSCIKNQTLDTDCITWRDGADLSPSALDVTTIGFRCSRTTRERSDGVDLMQVSEPPQTNEAKELQLLHDEIGTRMAWDQTRRKSRRRFQLCLALFLATFASTTLVGADYWPLEILFGWINPVYGNELLAYLNGFPWPFQERLTLRDHFWIKLQQGLSYSIPLMLILLCHEMGHYLQALRYSVPASLPFFIPLPLPPLGTMGAVILQGRGKADRKQLFDIAVSGPIAGLVVTIPVLLYGIYTSGYIIDLQNRPFEFGQPWIVKSAIEFVHGPLPAGMVFQWNGFATAGWVGVFITALNLLPIGQLDGGHLLYTMVGRAAHYVAWGLILVATCYMIWVQQYSYVLLLILVTLTGPRHPPARDDHIPLGWGRRLVGFATLSFLLMGFTLQPIVISQAGPYSEEYDGNQPQAAQRVDGWQFDDYEGLSDRAAYGLTSSSE